MNWENEIVLYGENFSFNFKKGISNIFSYECRDYESVDENSLSWVMFM